jgi:hypothetical protein
VMDRDLGFGPGNWTPTGQQDNYAYDHTSFCQLRTRKL